MSRVRRVNYNNLKDNLVGSQQVRLVFKAMYDTMWGNLGFQDLQLQGGSTKEVPGLKYEKGLLSVPRNLISWDDMSNDIPVKIYGSNPVKTWEFSEEFERAIDYDGAIMIRPTTEDLRAGYSYNRILDPRTLNTIAAHIALGGRVGNDDKETRVRKMAETLTPDFITRYGGRTKIFVASSVLLAHLDQYMSELSDHYEQFYRSYMQEARKPLVGAGGKNLAQSLVLAWLHTSPEHVFGGYTLVGGHEEKGLVTMALQPIKSLSTKDREELSIKEEDRFAIYDGISTTREMVLLFRAFKSLRYGTQKRQQKSFIISPEELGHDHKSLQALAEESFARYQKILDHKKRYFP